MHRCTSFTDENRFRFLFNQCFRFHSLVFSIQFWAFSARTQFIFTNSQFSGCANYGTPWLDNFSTDLFLFVSSATQTTHVQNLQTTSSNQNLQRKTKQSLCVRVCVVLVWICVCGTQIEWTNSHQWTIISINDDFLYERLRAHMHDARVYAICIRISYIYTRMYYVLRCTHTSMVDEAAARHALVYSLSCMHVNPFSSCRGGNREMQYTTEHFMHVCEYSRLGRDGVRLA